MAKSKKLSITDLWTPDQPLPGRAVLEAIADRLARKWDFNATASNGRRIRICYNQRLRSTLGRAILADKPEECSVELNTRLLREHPEELLPVLAHELAHVVVHLRYRRVPPHGLHFRTLMRAAGMPADTTHSLPTAHLRRRRRYIYLHRCSDCGYSFIARSIRRNYYCVACGPEMTWDVLRPEHQARARKA